MTGSTCFRWLRRRGKSVYAEAAAVGARVVIVFAILTASSVTVADQFARVYATQDKAALTEWGRRYENGEGVPSNVTRAIKLGD